MLMAVKVEETKSKKGKTALIIIVVLIVPLIVYLNTLPEFNKLFKFAFL